MEQAVSRDQIRRHTAMELALDILGRAAPGNSGPNLETVLGHATQINDFLRGK